MLTASLWDRRLSCRTVIERTKDAARTSPEKPMTVEGESCSSFCAMSQRKSAVPRRLIVARVSARRINAAEQAGTGDDGHGQA
jgi:hypothetical protein